MAETTFSNLPPVPKTDSTARTLLYYNNYADKGQEYKAEDVDSTVGFLTSKGFSNTAATTTAMVLLRQAKVDQLSTYSLLETLKGLDSLQLSFLVGQILNQNRSPTSALGYRATAAVQTYQNRNILP
jgi:hypothetical protein